MLIYKPAVSEEKRQDLIHLQNIAKEHLNESADLETLQMIWEDISYRSYCGWLCLGNFTSQEIAKMLKEYQI